MIKLDKGFERILMLLTGLREYRCRDCDQRFRAPDRRSTPREVPQVAHGTGKAGVRPHAA